jgi:hypothetical protein
MRGEVQRQAQRGAGVGTDRRRPSHDHNLRVVSWNVNGIRARMPRIAELLKCEQLASSRLAEHIVRCEVKHTYRQGRRPSNHAPLEIELEGLGECEDCAETAVAA